MEAGASSNQEKQAIFYTECDIFYANYHHQASAPTFKTTTVCANHISIYI